LIGGEGIVRNDRRNLSFLWMCSCILNKAIELRFITRLSARHVDQVVNRLKYNTLELLLERIPIKWNRLDETGLIPLPLREGLGVGFFPLAHTVKVLSQP
jgi:hypothetical protein